MMMMMMMRATLIRYVIASGQQECMQCGAIIAAAHFVGQNFDGICEFLGHDGNAVNSKMCRAQVSEWRLVWLAGCAIGAILAAGLCVGVAQ